MLMTHLIKPRMLRSGDRVAIVSPSWGGPGAIPARYEMGSSELEARFGLKVIPMRHALADPAWLKRHPEKRAEDLHDAFADPSIKAVIASIGGFDGIRVLRHLNLDVISANPKILLGYSDTTVFHMAALKAGLLSFYGPAVMSGIAENAGMFAYTEKAFRDTLMDPSPVGALVPADEWTEEFLDWTCPDLRNTPRRMTPNTGWKWIQGKGSIMGRLIGGCLNVLELLKGTDWWPLASQWEGAVFYWETSELKPSPETVEMWLMNYEAQGILQNVAAMIVGRPRDYTPEEVQKLEGILTYCFQQVGRQDTPIVMNMDFGHTDPMLILPNGASVIVDADRRTITLPEPAVME